MLDHQLSFKGFRVIKVDTIPLLVRQIWAMSVVVVMRQDCDVFLLLKRVKSKKRNARGARYTTG
jgi:hypothetical protein